MRNLVLRGLFAAALLCGFSASALADVTITSADTDKTISVKQGEALIVNLTGSHASGNFWFLDADLTPELILSGRTTESVAIPGAPETTTITFTTGDAGQVMFRASYRKPGTATPEKSEVAILVNVVAAP